MTDTILYIEDNETNIEIVTRILEREGYQIHTCTSGELGLELAQKIIPTLILVDLHLPGMNGLQITEALRALPELKHTKIMFLTADIYSREEAIMSGADDFMAKPIRRKTFLNKVQEVLDKPII